MKFKKKIKLKAWAVVADNEIKAWWTGEELATMMQYDIFPSKTDGRIN